MDDEDRNSREVQTGRRGRSRLRVRLPAKLQTRIENARVILVDLSMTGARLVADNPPAVGTEAMLHWDRYEAFGEVVWAQGVQFGLSFEEPISEQDVLATRELDDVARLPHDKELLRQAAREWVEGKF